MFLFCLFIFVLVGASSAELDACEFCLQNYIINLDFYADPIDCHHFIHCEYFNASHIHGTRHGCANGTYWVQRLLQCQPEGATPCSDPCSDDKIATTGCYGGGEGQCSTYFRCAHSTSYRFCCPKGTSFKAATCSCDRDPSCNDTCGRIPTLPTTTLRPPINDGQQCNDSYGNLLQPVEGHPNKFFIIDLADPALPRITKLRCAPGTEFNLTTCQCSNFANGSSNAAHDHDCLLYLPFENDTMDHSSSNYFTTVVEGNVTIDTALKATGVGSAHFTNGGLLQIDGLKNVDFHSSASWCLFHSLDGAGDLISNGDLNNASFLLSALSGQVKLTIQFVAPISTLVLQAADAAATGLQQVCVVVDNGTASIYVNNALKTSQPVLGTIATSFEPFWVGGSSFSGHIDEVLICRPAMTEEQIAAHYRGDLAYLVENGCIPPQQQPVLTVGHNEH